MISEYILPLVVSISVGCKVGWGATLAKLEPPCENPWACEFIKPAKSAAVGLTRSFAQEYGKYNIRTNTVIPGCIATERQIKLWYTPKYKKFIWDKQALKRTIFPNDVAQMVMFLASDQSTGCTKQIFTVDGGLTWSRWKLKVQ